MVSRVEVLGVVEMERRHQQKVAPESRSVGEYILMMEEYLARARTNWFCSKVPDGHELHSIRKLVAVGIRCMEEHGAPARIPTGEILGGLTEGDVWSRETWKLLVEGCNNDAVEADAVVRAAIAAGVDFIRREQPAESARILLGTRNA